MKLHRLAKIMSNAATLARRYRHLAWRLSLEDLEQVALLAQVDASTRFDMTRGTPFGAFTWRAAVIAAHRHVLTESAPVSGRHDPQALVGLYRHEFVEMAHEAPAPSPEAALAQEQWAACVRKRVAALVGKDGAIFITQLMTGEFKPADVARAHNVDIADVYHAVREAKKTISGDQELFDLWRTM